MHKVSINLGKPRKKFIEERFWSSVKFTQLHITELNFDGGNTGAGTVLLNCQGSTPFKLTHEYTDSNKKLV